LISVLLAVGIFFILGATELEGFQTILEGTLEIVTVILTLFASSGEYVIVFTSNIS